MTFRDDFRTTHPPRRMLLLTASAFAAWTAATPASGERPNIVVIVADDLNWNDCGPYGHPSIRTPNLDALARDGLTFERAYLTTNSCSPSRASILTGRYPHQTGAEQLHWPIPPGVPTLAQVLRDAGYHTAAAGKWHLGDAVREHFDRIEAASTAGFVLPSSKTAGAGAMIAADPSGCGDWVRVLAQRPRDRPFFAWLASLDPHREYADGALTPPHDAADVIVPPHLPDVPAVRRDMAMYYDEIGRLDTFVGEVVDELKRQEILDETLLVFLSDNGRPFPRDKTTLYDGGIRTPLIAHRPGVIPAGRRSMSLVSSVDIAATCLRAAGLSTDALGSAGNSFFDVLERPDRSHRRYAFAEDHWHDYEDHGRAVTDGDFKLIRNDYPDLPNTPPADAGRSPTWAAMRSLREAGRLTALQRSPFRSPRPTWELYDLRRDPAESRNVADDPAYAAVKQRLASELQSWGERTDDFLPTVRTPDEFDRRTGRPDASVRRRPRASKEAMFGTIGAY